MKERGCRVHPHKDEVVASQIPAPEESDDELLEVSYTINDDGKLEVLNAQKNEVCEKDKRCWR